MAVIHGQSDTNNISGQGSAEGDLGRCSMDSFPTLLTEAQAAQYLTLSVKTLQAWRSRGHGLPYHKIGRSVRYEKQTLQLFIEGQQRRSTSDPGST